MKSLYKIVVLPDKMEFPIPVDHNWIAMDSSGRWYSYINRPTLILNGKVRGYWFGFDHNDGEIIPYINGEFESGQFFNQLYYVG